MKVKAYRDALYKIVDIALDWRDSCRYNDFNMDVDNTTYLKDLQCLIDSNDGELFVLYNDDDTPVGYLGITIINSPLGKQRIATEHYWYVLKDFRGYSSLKLLKAAKNWAKEKGCSHIIFHASNIASDLHDDICKLYEITGMSKFETSYISKL